MTNTWTVDQCATHWGIHPSTWRNYVTRGYAPKPIPGYDDQRRRRWDTDTVKNYKRPGRGARTGRARIPTTELARPTNTDGQDTT